MRDDATPLWRPSAGQLAAAAMTKFRLDVAARHGLRVLAYEDGVIDAPRPARVQRLCAGGSHVDPGAIRLDM